MKTARNTTVSGKGESICPIIGLFTIISIINTIIDASAEVSLG